MKLFNVFLLISCLPTIASARSAAASVSSESYTKSRASSATVVEREINLGDIHKLALSSTEKFKITARGIIGNNPEIGAQVLHALLCHAEVNRGQTGELRNRFDHLMELSVDVDGISQLFGTPLHHAAMLTDHTDSAYFTSHLLRRGAVGTIKFRSNENEAERTALQIAQANSHDETAELLEAYGSPNSNRNSARQTHESSSDSCSVM